MPGWSCSLINQITKKGEGAVPSLIQRVYLFSLFNSIPVLMHYKHKQGIYRKNGQEQSRRRMRERGMDEDMYSIFNNC